MKLLDRVKQLKPINDVFFEKLIEDKNVCEEIMEVFEMTGFADILTIE